MGNLNIVVVRFILLTCLFVMVCVFHPLIRSSLFPLHINIRLQNHNCQQSVIQKKKTQYEVLDLESRQGKTNYIVPKPEK